MPSGKVAPFISGRQPQAALEWVKQVNTHQLVCRRRSGLQNLWPLSVLVVWKRMLILQNVSANAEIFEVC